MGLREALGREPPLWEVLRTPFLLNVAVRAYRGLPAADVTAEGTLQQRQADLIAAFVDRAFRRRPTGPRVATPDAVRTLAFVARALGQNLETYFFLEAVDAQWMPKRLRRLVTVATSLPAAVLLGATMGLPMALFFGPPTGIVAGALAAIGLSLACVSHTWRKHSRSRLPTWSSTGPVGSVPTERQHLLGPPGALDAGVHLDGAMSYGVRSEIAATPSVTQDQLAGAAAGYGAGVEDDRERAVDGSDVSTNLSVIGRLLEEVSWDGASVRRYRQGGRGLENVLTAEVLMALDFLPRTHFLGAVLNAAHGAESARRRGVGEIEDAAVTLLPDELRLVPGADTRGGRLIVQPDALITSPGCCVLVEAKRIRSSAFQPEQLAREYVAVLREAGPRVPLLLLVLGAPPPVLLARHGRFTIEDAIRTFLDPVLDRVDPPDLNREQVRQRIDRTCAWITWAEVGGVVAGQRERFRNHDTTVVASVDRLAAAVTRAVSWHT